MAHAEYNKDAEYDALQELAASRGCSVQELLYALFAEYEVGLANGPRESASREPEPSTATPITPAPQPFSGAPGARPTPTATFASVRDPVAEVYQRWAEEQFSGPPPSAAHINKQATEELFHRAPTSVAPSTVTPSISHAATTASPGPDPIYCTRCAHINEGGVTSCLNCGFAFPPAPPPVSPERERTVATAVAGSGLIDSSEPVIRTPHPLRNAASPQPSAISFRQWVRTWIMGSSSQAPSESEHQTAASPDQASISPPSSSRSQEHLPSANPRRNRVFVAYAQKDLVWLKALTLHLEFFAKQGVLELWDDTRISPGDSWRGELDSAIASAAVAVLLISPYFLASDFVAVAQLPPLLARAKSANLRIIPVLVTPSLYSVHQDLAEFQPANSPGKELSGLRPHQRHKLLAELALTIRTLLSTGQMDGQNAV